LVLKVDNIHVFYEESHILHGVTLHLEPNEIIGLIGNNGVGKTTLLRSILGLTDVRSGDIFFQDEDIVNVPPYKISRLGISLVPENREIFPDLSVHENLLIGTMKSKEKRKAIPEIIYEFFPILKERVNQKGSTLSGGEQQMLAIARGLVGEPMLLLVDEFSEGLSPLIIKDIVDIFRKVQKDGMTILMVEQDARLALHLSERIYIMEKGQISYHAFSEDLQSDSQILKDHLAI
jgi:branched-chain amino acid transport system ATP-binding protein